MQRHAYDSVHWYVGEVGASVVAESGIPSDRFHLGKTILWSLRNDPQFVMQIDGASDQSETNESVMKRTVRCAVALNALGLKQGDVMTLIAPNHIDLCIPQYAALYLGIIVAPIDINLGVQELCDSFIVTRPNIVFCQSEKTDVIDRALELAGVDCRVVTFNKGSKHGTFAELLENIDENAVMSFKPADFNPDETIAYLTSTSGTTGVPKAAAHSHKNFMTTVPYLWIGFSKFPTPTRMAIILSPLQWLSAVLHFLFSPILKFTRLQTSAPLTNEHITELINKYRPTYVTVSPTLMTSLTTVGDRCDFTCFECIIMGGSAVSAEIISEMKRLTKSENVMALYALSEISGLAFFPDFPVVPGSLGRPLGNLEYRLVDCETGKDVGDGGVAGELWLRGPGVFKGYYNNPEVTAETVTHDGWLKTGDIFRRDDSWDFYFVDRHKLLLKYKNNQISPLEIESVIVKHPGVLDVAVTGIPDKECGDLVVACVVRRPGCHPTAQEIKDLVKETLSDSKQLRGGVIFMDEFPLTSTTKVNRKALKQLAVISQRE